MHICINYLLYIYMAYCKRVNLIAYTNGSSKNCPKKDTQLIKKA